MTEKEYLELVAPPDSHADIIESYILDNKLDLVNERADISDNSTAMAQKRISHFYFYKNCGDANLAHDNSVETPTSKITLDIHNSDNFELDFFRLWICINDFEGYIDDPEHGNDFTIDLIHDDSDQNNIEYIPEEHYKIIKRRLDNRLIICIFRNERTVRYGYNKLTKISISAKQASSICGVIF